MIVIYEIRFEKDLTMAQEISADQSLIVVRDEEELEGLLKQGAWRLHASKVQISIELLGLRPKDRRRYEHQFSRALSACGCLSGAAFGMISLAVYLSDFGRDR